MSALAGPFAPEQSLSFYRFRQWLSLGKKVSQQNDSYKEALTYTQSIWHQQSGALKTNTTA